MDALDRLVKPVKIVALDLVGQPPTVTCSFRSLFDNQHIMGFADAGTHRLPIETGEIEAAEINNLGIDTKRFNSFLHTVHHGGIGQYRHGLPIAHPFGPTQRDHIIEIFRDQAIALV